MHRGPDGETLVLGLFLTPGGHRHQIPQPLPTECGPARNAITDLARHLPQNLSTFRYQGSLTTAPFSEPVARPPDAPARRDQRNRGLQAPVPRR